MKKNESGKEIQIFKNDLFGEIRTTEVNGDPVFCLMDVCKALDISNPRQCKSTLDEDGVSTNDVIDSLGRKQPATFINESNLYQVIFQSRKPEAKAFRKWVTTEVIPSIRKHGAYLTPQKIQEVLLNPDTIIQLAQNLKLEQERNRELSYTIEKQEPKVLFANAVETSNKSCLISELAKIISQNGVEIGQNRLFDWMRKNGYLCIRGESYNLPTQKSMELGLFEIKKTTINRPDGTILVSTTTKVTGRGQVYFVNKFLNKIAS